MPDVRLPDLGDVEDVTVVQWLKRVGDAVDVGDELVEVETSKAVFAVEAEAAGRLSRILCSKGDVVHAGDRLAELE